MKFQTNDRELGCLLMALNASKPETSHSNRKRKVRAFEQCDLERIEELTMPGSPRGSG
jgi:hypothetical protein